VFDFLDLLPKLVDVCRRTIAQARWSAKQRRTLCPDISEINLFAIARASSTSIPDFGMPEQKLNGPLATAGIESFRIAREAFKELEMSEGGRTIILIGLLRRCRPAS